MGTNVEYYDHVRVGPSYGNVIIGVCGSATVGAGIGVARIVVLVLTTWGRVAIHTGVKNQWLSGSLTYLVKQPVTSRLLS